MKKTIALICLLALGLALLSACGGAGAEGEPVGSCTLRIDCSTILDHREELDPAKAELLPEEGLLLLAEDVPVYAGDSVFDMLLREMTQRKLHLEYNGSADTNAYVEGLFNIYEFDCGETSGWVYSVNGEFSDMSCSAFPVADGDTVAFLYTCDRGRDVNGAAGYVEQP